MTMAYQGARRAARRGVTIAVLVALLGLGIGLARAMHVGPLFGLHAPHVHLSQTIHGPTQTTVILQRIRDLGHVHASDATYSWGQSTSSEHKTLGFTTSTAHHEVTLVGDVGFDVDASAAAWSIPAPGELVLYFPPPVPTAPTVDPASQAQIDSCTNRVLWPFTLAESCPADPLKYQEQAIAQFTYQASHDTGTIDNARASATNTIACLIGPTGWSVQVLWTDAPNVPVPFVAATCAAPLHNRLPPVPTTESSANR